MRPVGTDFPIPVKNGTAHRRKASLATHTIGRLLARVVLRAGAAVEESIVESAVFDLSTGARVSDDVAALFLKLEAGRVKAAKPDAIPDAQVVPARAPEALVQLLLADLQEQSAERVAAQRAAAEKEVAAELERLDRYFAAILADKTDAEEVATITALHERRRAEELRRYRVTAIVHPLQLIQAEVLVQRVEWELRSKRGPKARLAAQRAVAGVAAWTIACPKCGRAPEALVVCTHEDVVCDSCSKPCSVCEADFCGEHGIAMCRVDEQPACAEHARVCPSCRMAHCSAHEGLCAEGDHPACSACLEACGSCGRVVCSKHAEQSRADAPKGSRRLCGACVRHCEGGKREIVGMDEVTACATCGKLVCTEHSAQCVVDGATHCAHHLEPMRDSTGIACREHRKDCHIDGGVFSIAGAAECPVCGKNACAHHRAKCSHCGRQVCTADWSQQLRRCSTCGQLAAVADPPEDVVKAGLAAAGRRAPMDGQRATAEGAWRMARDRTHVVVELDLGWRRRTVFTLRHGETEADGVVSHSLVRSKVGRRG